MKVSQTAYVVEKMNRDITGETDSFQQTSSSSYLVYLFIVSAAVIVFLPYVFPFTGILLRSAKKVDVVGKVKSDPIKKSSSSRFTSLTSDAVIKKTYYSESTCEALQAHLMDMQKVVQNERERTFNLENEIRILKISETFLKERVHNLEERNSRKEFTTGYTSSVEYMMQNTPLMTESKRGDSDIIVHELLRMVLKEKDRTSTLEMEIRNLKKSEIALVGRVQKLEEKVASYGETDVSDREVNKRDYSRN